MATGLQCRKDPQYTAAAHRNAIAQANLGVPPLQINNLLNQRAICEHTSSSPGKILTNNRAWTRGPLLATTETALDHWDYTRGKKDGEQQVTLLSHSNNQDQSTETWLEFGNCSHDQGAERKRRRRRGIRMILKERDKKLECEELRPEKETTSPSKDA
ncbi:uncharacterized protein MYCFIDRAFT_177488 [Pseudocercospora fijiensis CIRAD86]|uniref:Uncharacterized protein n=1 Tax=Pseudocercospora fijiensis (strain CIRAD86) TaxID=383855 RepID=M3A7F0_PSEFD|nr:uncharacterized protein MYCFIDRAFT_177488 [Pseudocercospora fijiensis CIRAD86]EME80546.1 hypothetical protein MYCFIDRAFT_177488 [Pseudocercospora fijiensis CIRAD86]